MKKLNVRVAALLFCGTLLMTSCQGLIDAIVGDNVAQPTVPTTTPATAKPNEVKVTIEDEEYIISSLSELDKLMKELDEQLWGSSSEDNPIEVKITAGDEYAATDATDNTITLPLVDKSNVVIDFVNDITTSKDKPLVIKSEEGKNGETSTVTINLTDGDDDDELDDEDELDGDDDELDDDDDDEGDYLTIDMPSSNVTLESDKGATYDKVVSTADEITIGKGVTVEELEIEEGRYKETEDGGKVKNVTYNYNPIEIKAKGAATDDDDADDNDDDDDDDDDDDETDFQTYVELTSEDNEIEIDYEISEKYADEDEAKDIEIEWESDNPDVAVYDKETGKIVAKGEDGFATITATIKGDEHTKTAISVSVEKTPKDIIAPVAYTVGGDPIGSGETPDIDELSEINDEAWKNNSGFILIQNGRGRQVSVKTFNADGSAILDLSGINGYLDKGEFTVVYPGFADFIEVGKVGKEIKDAQNTLKVTESNSENAGKLEYIKKRLNIHSGTGMLTIDKDGTRRIVGAVEMKPQVAIWKLALEDENGQTVNAETLTILSNGKTTTEFKKKGGMDELYLPVWGDEKSRSITIKATDAAGKAYFFSKKGVTLAAGKYYESTVKLTGSTSVDATAGVEAVDLGLTSGTKWANMNVSYVTVGDNGFFAWGDTKGYRSVDTSDYHKFSWKTYKWCNGTKITLTKYNNNSEFGTVDNKVTLEAADDAATDNWGSLWRIPTAAEWEELLATKSNTTDYTWSWVAVDGLNGWRITRKSTGANIFLPAAGYRDDEDTINERGNVGNYWSSSLDESSAESARYFYFNSTEVEMRRCGRFYGQSVRAVLK